MNILQIAKKKKTKRLEEERLRREAAIRGKKFQEELLDRAYKKVLTVLAPLKDDRRFSSIKLADERKVSINLDGKPLFTISVGTHIAYPRTNTEGYNVDPNDRPETMIDLKLKMLRLPYKGAYSGWDFFRTCQMNYHIDKVIDEDFAAHVADLIAEYI